MMVMMAMIVVVMETEIKVMMLLVIGSDDDDGDRDDGDVDGYDDGDKVSTSWKIMIRHRITHALLFCQKFVRIF